MGAGHVKTSGAVFNRFCNDPHLWANGEYLDSAVIVVNGAGTASCPAELQPDDEVLIMGGFVRRAVGKVPLPFFFQAWRAFMDEDDEPVAA